MQQNLKALYYRLMASPPKESVLTYDSLIAKSKTYS